MVCCTTDTRIYKSVVECNEMGFFGILVLHSQLPCYSLFYIVEKRRDNVCVLKSYKYNVFLRQT